MKNLLEFILIHIVTYPDDVRVDEQEQEQETVYTIHVHADDLGRVIGKHGNIIQSIRSIAKVRAMKEQKRIRIVVDEPAEKPVDVAKSTEASSDTVSAQ
jgi:predicted RNA-binding protein YlqC (UPF0109 family)